MVTFSWKKIVFQLFVVQSNLSVRTPLYCWFSVSLHSKQIKIKIKTVQQIKSIIWEMKGGTYTQTIAKFQVRGIFCIRDIRRNYPNLKRFVQRRHAGAHLDELQHGGRKRRRPTNRNICYRVLLQKREFILRGTHKH